MYGFGSLEAFEGCVSWESTCSLTCVFSLGLFLKPTFSSSLLQVSYSYDATLFLIEPYVSPLHPQVCFNISPDAWCLSPKEAASGPWMRMNAGPVMPATLPSSRNVSPLSTAMPSVKVSTCLGGMG